MLLDLMTNHSMLQISIDYKFVQTALKELSNTTEDEQNEQIPRFSVLRIAETIWGRLALGKADAVSALCQALDWPALASTSPGLILIQIDIVPACI